MGDIYEFGGYRLVAAERQLLRAGVVMPLTPKAFDVLVALVKDAGHLLTKDELMRQVWPDTFVEESTLAQNIATLRKVLGESAAAAQFIETVPKRGYRFIAPVGVSREEVPEVVAEEHVVTRVSVEEEVPVARRAMPVWAWIAGAVAVLMAAGGAWFAFRPKPAQPIRSLAVLPFVNMSAKADQEYFSDGLTEEIINALAPVPGLQVVARTSAFQFKGKNVDIRTIGKSLGADAVLEGSVRIDGNRLRVTAQLNSTVDGYHYWSRTWEHAMTDVFAVEQEIAQQVVAALGRGSATHAPQVKPLTGNLDAHNDYLQGQYFKNRVIEGMAPRAVEAFEKALAKDPGFAAAHAQIGQTYIWAQQTGKMSAGDVFPRVKEHVRKALELDPNLALAHAVQADVSFLSEWDFPAAERSFRRAMELNPADAEARHEFSHYLLAMGRFPEALEEAQRIVQMDPVSLASLTHLQLHFVMARDFRRAIEAADRALAIDPRDGSALLFLKSAYEGSGQWEKAVEVTAKRSDVDAAVVTALRAGLREGGEMGYWKAWYDVSLRRPAGGARELALAGYCARLGREQEALERLEKAIELRESSVVYLNVSWVYDGIRARPDFERLVRRIGLPVR